MPTQTFGGIRALPQVLSLLVLLVQKYYLRLSLLVLLVLLVQNTDTLWRLKQRCEGRGRGRTHNGRSKD